MLNLSKVVGQLKKGREQTKAKFNSTPRLRYWETSEQLDPDPMAKTRQIREAKNHVICC